MYISWNMGDRDNDMIVSNLQEKMGRLQSTIYVEILVLGSKRVISFSETKEKRQRTVCAIGGTVN